MVVAEEKIKEVIIGYCGESGYGLFQQLSIQEPQKTDAIILLQGDRLDRVGKVNELYSRGVAEVVVISGNNDLIGRGKRNEENDISLSEIKQHLMSLSVPEEAIFIDDQSMNTLDQAVNVIKLAKARNWQSLIVVTSPYHLLRAYLTFVGQATRGGWPGHLFFQVATLDWSKVPSGRERTAREMLVIEMKKMRQYQNDMATIEEGLNYFNNK
ncbi:MAG: YdcF family protein [bacterium]